MRPFSDDDLKIWAGFDPSAVLSQSWLVYTKREDVKFDLLGVEA